MTNSKYPNIHKWLINIVILIINFIAIVLIFPLSLKVSLPVILLVLLALIALFKFNSYLWTIVFIFISITYGLLGHFMFIGSLYIYIADYHNPIKSSIQDVMSYSSRLKSQIFIINDPFRPYIADYIASRNNSIRLIKNGKEGYILVPLSGLVTQYCPKYSSIDGKKSYSLSSIGKTYSIDINITSKSYTFGLEKSFPDYEWSVPSRDILWEEIAISSVDDSIAPTLKYVTALDMGLYSYSMGNYGEAIDWFTKSRDLAYNGKEKLRAIMLLGLTSNTYLSGNIGMFQGVMYLFDGAKEFNKFIDNNTLGNSFKIWVYGIFIHEINKMPPMVYKVFQSLFINNPDNKHHSEKQDYKKLFRNISQQSHHNDRFCFGSNFKINKEKKQKLFRNITKLTIELISRLSEGKNTNLSGDLYELKNTIHEYSNNNKLNKKELEFYNEMINIYDFFLQIINGDDKQGEESFAKLSSYYGFDINKMIESNLPFDLGSKPTGMWWDELFIKWQINSMIKLGKNEDNKDLFMFRDNKGILFIPSSLILYMYSKIKNKEIDTDIYNLLTETIGKSNLDMLDNYINESKKINN